MEGVDKEIVLVKDKLTELQQEVLPFKIYIQKEGPMLEYLQSLCRQLNGATQSSTGPFSYSYLSESAGFVFAALKVW